MKSIPKEQWSDYCKVVTDALQGLRAEIEVGSLELGDQVQASSLPIIGLAYDHKDDLFEVALKGLDHLIRRPEQFFVEENSSGISAMLVIDYDLARHLIQFKRPLMLAGRAE